jgi:hypothetical protein
MASMSNDALARARQSWRAAEARLYPLAMINVDGYQRALVLVAATCEQLRAVATTSADLVACQPRAVEYVAAACDATATSAQGLEPDDIFGSAAAARDRELAGEERRQARLAAVERGRAAGADWTDLHADVCRSCGCTSAPAGPSSPRSVRMRPPGRPCSSSRPRKSI